MNDGLIRLLLLLAAGITTVSGGVQLIAPTAILDVIATSSDPFSAQLFATVGMFMFITGALFLQSLLSRSDQGAIPFWIGVQKFAAAVLVYVGWSRGFFVAMALGVAAFDAATGALCFVFWRRLRQWQ